MRFSDGAAVNEDLWRSIQRQLETYRRLMEGPYSSINGIASRSRTCIGMGNVSRGSSLFSRSRMWRRPSD
jgi:hypothetical protein